MRMPTIWASLRGLGKDEKRILFQAFNMTMLTAMLCLSAVQGLLTWDFGRALLISLPGSIIGARLGHKAYVLLAVHHYDRIVLGLLLLSGATLLWSNL